MWDCFQGTNLSFNLLIILVFLTETENRKRYQGPVASKGIRGSGLTTKN